MELVQGSLFRLVETHKEDVSTVLRELTSTCTDCRLSILHPYNRGLVSRGNPLAKIACISEAPGDKEMDRGIPLTGPSGQLFERWCRFLNLDSKTELFITNVVQCQPEKVNKEGHLQQRQPDDREIGACFPNRALRILKAMPNLEVVWCLGLVAARCLLGGEPTVKTHENMWFMTSLLPGVAIYVTTHPSALLRNEKAGAKRNETKLGQLQNGLEQFRTEYLKAHKTPQIAADMYKEYEESLQ